MKVLHVYRTYFPESQGGVEEAIRQICLNTTRNGHENRVLTLAERGGQRVIVREECTVYRSDRHLSLRSCDIGLQALPLFRELVDWCDVVHYHFPWPFADFLELVAGGKKPYIITYHSDIVRQKVLGLIYRPLMSRFLASAEKIVATSRNYFTTSPVLSCMADKVEVVPLAINESSYPSLLPSRVKALESQYGRNFFLFVGVFRYYKGLHILLHAAQNADYKVIIAGSGPIEKKLKKHACSLGLTNVIFPGYVSDEDKMAMLHLSRAVVFPSYLRAEAFGMTLVEGAMMGKPLISTEVGTGTSYVNVHAETGIVVAPGNARELREAMDYLAFHPTIAASMGEKARERFERLFAGEVTGAKYQRIYEQVMLKHSARKAATTFTSY